MSHWFLDLMGNLSLFSPIGDDGILYLGKFNPYLMAAVEFVSVVGFFAVFSALEFVKNNSHHGKTFTIMQWAIGAAMGLCMWIVHFISLIGYVLPVQVAYDLSLTAWSVLPVMVGSTLAINMLINHPNPNLGELTRAGWYWVCGMLVTYVLGVYAIDFAGMVRAKPAEVLGWGVGAWLMAIVALGLPGWLGHRMPAKPQQARLISCLLSGTLVYGIHVYGMEITTYMTDPTADLVVEGHDPIWLAAIVMGVAALLGTSAWLLFMRWFMRRIARTNMLLNQTLELTHSGYFEFRADDQTMLLSKHAAELFGLKPRFDLTFQSWPEWLYGVERVDPAQAKSFQSDVDDLLTDRVQKFQRTFPFQASDQSQVLWLSTVGTAVWDASDNEKHYYFAAQDVTEEHLLKQELHASKEMADSANKTKGEFLANMSHEIRTPMNAILGLTELALRQPLSPKLSDYLGKVHLAAQNLLGIINDILDLSKVESGKMELEIIPFNLDDVLDNLSTVLATSIEQKGLELLFHRSPDLEVKLKGDPLRLGQVLLNLCGNARKFTEKGSIVVKVSAIQRDDLQSTLLFEIIDTGIGMTPEQVNKLFQPFSQADASTTRKYGGTGLGLAISKQLVELMGGQIGLKSTPGVGSTFHFEIPLQHDESSGGGDLLIQELQDMRVLVVDDNPFARDILKAHLTHFRCQVQVCETADLALPLISQADVESPFQLILMDYRMPGLNGLEAAQRIQRQMGLKHVPPIILVTAASHFDDQEDVEVSQVVREVLYKPVNASMLFDAIMNVLGIQFLRTHQPSRRQQLQVQGLERIVDAKILLAEDNPINQEVAKEFLATMGLQVHIVNNGQEALDALHQQDYDLVLMDVQMPVMDGYKAAAEIRRDPKWANLPVIAMTANVMDEDKKTALAAGMNDHVAKPIVMNQLQSVLLKWLQHYTPLQGAPIIKVAPVVESVEVAALPADVDFLITSAALNLIGGNQKLLTKLLIDFLDNHAEDAEKIKTCIRNQQRADAERMAHTMKGLAGMLVAKPLQASSMTLEKTLGNELLAVPDALIHEWERALDLVVTHLQAWRASGVVEPTTPPPVRSQDEVILMMDRLEKLLQDFNPEAEELAQELGQSNQNQEKVWSDIGQKLHDFDYEAALALLHKHRGEAS